MDCEARWHIERSGGISAGGRVGEDLERHTGLHVRWDVEEATGLLLRCDASVGLIVDELALLNTRRNDTGRLLLIHCDHHSDAQHNKRHTLEVDNYLHLCIQFAFADPLCQDRCSDGDTDKSNSNGNISFVRLMREAEDKRLDDSGDDERDQETEANDNSLLSL